MPHRFHTGKSMIMCYSYSGNTLQIAREIQRQTEAIICEIYPKQPYPMLFENVVPQARQEIEEGYLPNLFPMPEVVNEYQIIFVGTPNWCGTVAPPVASFLQENDLKGKLLLPFYSHCGGGRGNVERDIRQMCPDAMVAEGISIINDGGSALSQKIDAWLGKYFNDIQTEEEL